MVREFKNQICVFFYQFTFYFFCFFLVSCVVLGNEHLSQAGVLSEMDGMRKVHIHMYIGLITTEELLLVANVKLEGKRGEGGAGKRVLLELGIERFRMVSTI